MVFDCKIEFRSSTKNSQSKLGLYDIIVIIYKASFVANALPVPVLMDAIRLQQASSLSKSSMVESGIVIFVDRLYGSLGLGVLICISVAYWLAGLSAGIFVCLFLGLCFFCLSIDKTHKRLSVLFSQLVCKDFFNVSVSWKFVSSASSLILRLLGQLALELESPWDFFFRIVLSVGIHVGQALILVLIANTIIQELPVVSYFISYFVGISFQMLGFTPGGLGVSEFGFASTMSLTSGVERGSTFANFVLIFFLFRIARIIATIPGLYFWLHSSVFVRKSGYK